MKEQTCKTFDTPREAAAFMMGLRCGASEQIECRIDPEETQTVLVDIGDDEADGIYLEAAHKFNEVVALAESVLDIPCPYCGRQEGGKWSTPCPSDDCPSHAGISKDDLTKALKMAGEYMNNGDPVEAESCLDLVLRTNPGLHLDIRKLLEKAHSEISVGSPEKAEIFLGEALSELQKGQP